MLANVGHFALHNQGQRPTLCWQIVSDVSDTIVYSRLVVTSVVTDYTIYRRPVPFAADVSVMSIMQFVVIGLKTFGT